MSLRYLVILLTSAILPIRAGDQQPLSPALAGALRKSGLPPSAESVTTPLLLTIAGLSVEVDIDGKPVQLLLDTGASCTFLSPEAALKIGLIAEGRGDSAISVSGEWVAGQRVLTKRIGLGGAWTENEPVFVTRMIAGIDGLLGIATLADWDIRIDPSAKNLTLFPAGKAPPLKGETVMPLACQLLNPEVNKSNPQALRKMILGVPVRIGKHELMATPDTGHGGILELTSVLMEKSAPEAMKDALPGLVRGTTLSGKAVSRSAKLPEFTFGPDTLKGMNAEFIDASPGGLREQMGLIGLNLLRHYVMTFRFSAGELRIKPLGTVQEITRTSTAGINLDHECKILSVFPDGPADKAGLRAGDELLSIEGHPLKTMKHEEFLAFKRLPPGSGVKVTYRRGEAEPEEVTLVLAKE